MFNLYATAFISPSQRTVMVAKTANAKTWTRERGDPTMSIHKRSRHRPSSMREIIALGGLGLLWLAAAMFCIAALSSTARATPVVPVAPLFDTGGGKPG